MKLTPLSKMRRRIKVKDHPKLERDPRTNAIVTNDPRGYEKYMNHRKVLQDQQDRITNLENELNLIKDLLLNK